MQGTPVKAGPFFCLGSFLLSPGSFKVPSELKFFLAQKKLNATEFIARYGQVLQCPARRLAVTRYSQGHGGTVRLRNQEAAVRMRLRPLEIAVLAAKRRLNLPDGFHPLVPRLPLPEHHKSLSAHAAMHLSVARRTFAEHLHLPRLHPPDSPPDSLWHESHHSPHLRSLPIPSIGSLAVLLSHRLLAFSCDESSR